jgi:hypothetical protein
MEEGATGSQDEKISGAYSASWVPGPSKERSIFIWDSVISVMRFFKAVRGKGI